MTTPEPGALSPDPSEPPAHTAEDTALGKTVAGGAMMCAHRPFRLARRAEPTGEGALLRLLLEQADPHVLGRGIRASQGPRQLGRRFPVRAERRGRRAGRVKLSELVEIAP